MVGKSTTHVFDAYAVEVSITEYPHSDGDEFHLDIKPQVAIEDVSLTGNPEDKQSLFFKMDDALVWIKGSELLEKLEEATERYRKTWDDHYQSLKGSAKT